MRREIGIVHVESLFETFQTWNIWLSTWNRWFETVQTSRFSDLWVYEAVSTSKWLILKPNRTRERVSTSRFFDFWVSKRILRGFLREILFRRRNVGTNVDSEAKSEVCRLNRVFWRLNRRLNRCFMRDLWVSTGVDGSFSAISCFLPAISGIRNCYSVQI